jgi:hypothetical protein
MPEPTSEPAITYYGSVDLASNPFAEEGQSGNVQIVLEQEFDDGYIYSAVIYDGVMTYGDFASSPSFSFEGFGDAISSVVEVYVEGVLFDSYNVMLTP